MVPSVKIFLMTSSSSSVPNSEANVPLGAASRVPCAPCLCHNQSAFCLLYVVRVPPHLVSHEDCLLPEGGQLQLMKLDKLGLVLPIHPSAGVAATWREKGTVTC